MPPFSVNCRHVVISQINRHSQPPTVCTRSTRWHALFLGAAVSSEGRRENAGIRGGILCQLPFFWYQAFRLMFEFSSCWAEAKG